MSRIIIVEDDPMIAEIYDRKFTELGFAVLLAENGKQALETIKLKEIDVVLTDLIMPEMGGLELIKNLCSGEYDPKIKIIVLSNLFDSRDEAIKLGANGFLAKASFTPTEMVEEVKKILDAQEK